jgi:MFS family permease
VSLRHNRDFSIFWAVQTLSVAGDSFSLVAIPLLVLHSTGSVAQMGLLTGVAGAASMVTGTFAGAIADRVDRRTLLIVCDLARAALYAVIPLCWLVSPQVWLLYAVVPLAAGFGLVFQVGYVTAVPNLVASDHITAANGRLFATQAAAGVAGPLLAGLVSGALGPAAAIGIDAASFAVSAVGLAFVRLRTTAGAWALTEANAAVSRWAPWRDFVAGARFLWRHPVLKTLTVLLSFFVFLSIGLTDIIIYYLKADLGRGDGVVGYVLAIAAMGTVAGSAFVAPLRRTLGFGTCWIGCHVMFGVTIGAVGLTRAVPLVAALAMAAMFFLSVAAICSMSLRQEVTPDHLLGRVTSTFWTIQRVLSPLGAALLTAATARVGVPPVLLGAGTACVLIGAVAVFTPIRMARPERLAFDTP